MTIQDNLNRIQQAKSDIKAAIESKGVYVDDADKIDIYASKIYEIEQGGGSANIGKRTFTIQENGQTDYLSLDFGYDGWNRVTIRSRVQNPFYTVSQAIEYGATDRPYPSGDFIFVTGRVSEITNIKEDGRYSFIITDEVNTMTITNSSLVNDISEIQVNDYVVIRGLLGKTGNSISSNPTLFLKYSNTGGGDTGVINMADRGLRFFHFNGENLDGYDFSTVTDFTRFFSWMPQLRSDINITFNGSQSMDYMFEYVASDIEEGIEINIDFNNNTCFNFSNVFEGSRLKRFPRFTNMNDETRIESYRPFGNCHIHNFDNWQDFPWNKLRGEGGNSLFASMDNLVEVPAIDLSNVEVANGMFGDCYNLERIENLNFQNIGAFSWVFSGCEKLTYIGDLGNFENCWQFDNPFEGCPNLITLPRMHNLKKSLNLSNMVQMDAGTAGLFLANDVYNFAENGNKQDGEGVLTVPAYFNDNEFWNTHKNTIESKGWTIEYV